MMQAAEFSMHMSGMGGMGGMGGMMGAVGMLGEDDRSRKGCVLSVLLFIFFESFFSLSLISLSLSLPLLDARACETAMAIHRVVVVPNWCRPPFVAC